MAEEHPERNGRPGGRFGRIVGSVVSPIVENLDLDEMVDQVDVDEVVSRSTSTTSSPASTSTRSSIEWTSNGSSIESTSIRSSATSMSIGSSTGWILTRCWIVWIRTGCWIVWIPTRCWIVSIRIGLLDRVDPDALLDRVDPNRLLDRVDPDRLLDRVDANRLLDRVDVNQLVARTELGEIIARSTTGVFTQLLDVARTQIIITDQVAQAVAARVLRGARRELPPTPGGVGEEPESARLSPIRTCGEGAGPFRRLGLAFSGVPGRPVRDRRRLRRGRPARADRGAGGLPVVVRDRRGEHSGRGRVSWCGGSSTRPVRSLPPGARSARRSSA